MEKPHVVRAKYLRKMKEYRQQQRCIVFLDETWVDNDLSVKKCWQSSKHGIDGVLSGVSSSGKCTVILSFIPICTTFSLL